MVVSEQVLCDLRGGALEREVHNPSPLWLIPHVGTFLFYFVQMDSECFFPFYLLTLRGLLAAWVMWPRLLKFPDFSINRKQTFILSKGPLVGDTQRPSGSGGVSGRSGRGPELWVGLVTFLYVWVHCPQLPQLPLTWDV